MYAGKILRVIASDIGTSFGERVCNIGVDGEVVPFKLPVGRDFNHIPLRIVIIGVEKSSGFQRHLQKNEISSVR